MLAVEDFIADLNDQLVRLVIVPFAGLIYVGGCLLQDRIGRDHFARYQILAAAEMLERALWLLSDRSRTKRYLPGPPQGKARAVLAPRRRRAQAFGSD